MLYSIQYPVIIIAQKVLLHQFIPLHVFFHFYIFIFLCCTLFVQIGFSFTRSVLFCNFFPLFYFCVNHPPSLRLPVLFDSRSQPADQYLSPLVLIIFPGFSCYVCLLGLCLNLCPSFSSIFAAGFLWKVLFKNSVYHPSIFALDAFTTDKLWLSFHF